MDAVTLSEAVADVRSYLDDRQGRRWDANQVRRALHSALSSCVELYAVKGGDRYDVEISRTTDGENGVLLEEEAPLAIRLVLLDGQWQSPLRAADPSLRGTPDEEDRDLIIRYTAQPALPTADTDYLLGARAWPVMERWVCMRAALELGITDKDQRADLERQAEAKQSEALSSERTPKSLPWPRGPHRRKPTLRWLWSHETRRITLYHALR